jgi:hypothetical protein
MNANARNMKLVAPGLAMAGFLAVQAIRHLVQVNGQFGSKTESRAGQVATWMTTTLLLVAAYLSTNEVKTYMMSQVVLATLFVGVMGSGIAMIYASTNTPNPETNRRWFGIAHVIYALIILAYSVYSFV